MCELFAREPPFHTDQRVGLHVEESLADPHRVDRQGRRGGDRRRVWLLGDPERPRLGNAFPRPGHIIGIECDGAKVHHAPRHELERVER